VAELRLGLVGCGRLAERGYVPAAARAVGVRLAAVADPVSARCAAVAPGVPSFPSAAELLAARAADLLVLATPPTSHLPDARLAASAGVPTLVEKPPAPTLHETAELAALDRPPWLAFNRRFDPALRPLRELARRPGVLDLRLVLHTRPGSWRAHEVDLPVALDLGPHAVDLAFWLSGAEPDSVTGSVDGTRMTARIELAGGRGVAHVSCNANRPYRERVTLEAEAIVLEVSRGGLLTALADRFRGSPLVPSLVLQLEAFARAARGEQEPDLATAIDGVRVMGALECVTS
jgi:myo-inositol 2-dehydrogenase / D-chiro-inositol 1-dehydrogenase